MFYCGNGDIVVKKENLKSESYCCQEKASCFDYRGIKNALVQNPSEIFTPRRIILIQMSQKYELKYFGNKFCFMFSDI